MGDVISLTQLKLNQRTIAINILSKRMIPITSDSFFKAVITNDDDAVKLFIQSGFDVNQEEPNGNTGLSVACYYGHKNIVSMLIPLANKQNSKCLLSAISNDHFDILKILLSSGFDVNTPSDRGVTALSVAVLKKSISMVNLIIQHKGDVNLKDDRGDTALMLSVVGDHLPIIDALIKAGADINVSANDGFTPALLATYSNNLKILTHLFNNGANLSHVTITGHSILDMAKNASNKEMVAFLESVKNNSDF